MLIILRVFICVTVSFFLSVAAFADINPKIHTEKIKRVIYITFDGTRWQDIFLDRIYFQKLWSKYAKDLTFYGVPLTTTKMETASVPISLPSYQSQMAGSVQPCNDNNCGYIRVETFPEKIVHQLHLKKKEVATFASWPEIGFAVERILGTTYTNTGNMPAYDPDTQLPDSMMNEINQKQIIDHPSDVDRWVNYTFAQALHYLNKYEPRFLWMSFDEADNAAHRGDLLAYHQALVNYDDMLDALFITLKALMMDKETMVIVTTDHGRGNGINWITHGPEYPESKQTWAFVMNGELKQISQDGSTYQYSTLSIRPTVEKALGL